MKKIICMLGCILGFVIGCGSSDIVVSGTSGSGGFGSSEINYIFPCSREDNGKPCRIEGSTGKCEYDICVACDDWPFRSIKEGYPMDEGACFSIVCDVPSPNKGLAYWQVQMQSVGKACSTEGVSGTCVNDGRCCEVPDYSTNPPTIKCSSFPKDNF